MKIDVFLKLLETKKGNDQAEFISARIKNQYVPIAKKCECAERIAAQSFGNGKLNSVYKYVLTCMALLDLYTDFSYNKDKNSILNDYDKFNKLGLFDVILNAIDENEIKEFNMIIDMCYSDYIFNQESDIDKLTKVIDTKVS